MLCSDTVLTVVYSSEQHRQHVSVWHGTYNGQEHWTAQTICCVLTWYLQWSRAPNSTDSMFWSVMVLTMVKNSEQHRQYVLVCHGTYNGKEFRRAQTVCCVLTQYLQWSRALNSADSILCSELWHNHSFRTSWLEWRSFLRIEIDSNRKENRWLSGSTNFVP